MWIKKATFGKTRLLHSILINFIQSVIGVIKGKAHKTKCSSKPYILYKPICSKYSEGRVVTMEKGKE